MLCLNCRFVRDEVTDATEELEELWKRAKKLGYSIVVFCEKLREVKVGTPPSPACTVTECGEFAEA